MKSFPILRTGIYQQYLFHDIEKDILLNAHNVIRTFSNLTEKNKEAFNPIKWLFCCCFFQTKNTASRSDHETQAIECETNCSILDRTCSTIWWRTSETNQYTTDLVAILLFRYTVIDSNCSHFDFLDRIGFIKNNSENYSENTFAQGAREKRMILTLN